MKTVRPVILALVASLCAAVPVSAQNTWTAGSSTDFSWSTASNWSGGVPLSTDNVVFPFTVPNPGALANPQIISLPSASFANSLSFANIYGLTGAGSLNLTSGSVFSDYAAGGYTTVQLTGSGGLTKTGYGALILGNSSNDFTGAMTLSNGIVAANSAGALGSDPGTIIVSGNPTRSNGVVFATGGTLALGGGYNGQTYTRAITVTGGGNSGDGQAFYSAGNNTFSGDFAFGNTAVAGSVNRMASVFGTATFNNFTAAGNGQFSQIQGPGNMVINGVVTIPAGAFLEKQGITTQGGLIINGTFSGTGELRSTLGYTRLAATNGGIVLAPNGGQFELRTNSPATAFSTSPLTFRGSISGNSNASIFADHAAGSIGLINQQVVFGTTTWATNNTTHTFTSRNGFGLTFTGTHTFATGNNYTVQSNVSGTNIFSGNISSTDTTARTFTFFGNGDQRFNGNFLGSTTAHNLSKQGQGMATIVGTAATWSGTTTISNGTLTVPKLSSLTTGALNLGNATTSGGILNYIGTATTGAGETSAKAILLNTTTAQSFILANQAGTAPTPLILTGTITGVTGVKNFVLGGFSTQLNEMQSSIPDTTTLSLIKFQPGTWVLSGANTYAGSTSISAGTLIIKDTFSGVSRDVLPGTALIFGASSSQQSAGGTLQYLGTAAAPSTEFTGALTLTAGEGKVVVTAGAGGTAALTFGSFGTATAGGTANIQPDAASQVVISGTSGFVHKALFFQNTNYAYSDGVTPGLIRAPVYGTDAGFVTSAAALTAGSHNEITGSFSNAAVAVSTLRINGSQTLTMTGLLTTPGILMTNGTGNIGGTGITTGAATELVIRVAGAGDTLTLDAPITGTSTLGVSKSGAGTLILNVANANTSGGPFAINEGTVRLGSATATLGVNNIALAIRQGGTLDLNGFTPTTNINVFNGAGTVTNTAAGTTSTFVIGNNNASTTNLFWTGVFNDGGPTAKLAVTKAGSGTGSFTGLSNFTGTLRINAGVYSVNLINDIGNNSPMGRGDATSSATNAASLVFAGGTLQYVGTSAQILQFFSAPSVSTNRLFTLAGSGTIDSSPSFGSQSNTVTANNAALIFNQTVPVSFSGAGARTLTLSGSSTGDNEMRLQLINNPNANEALSITKAGTGLWHLSNPNNTYTGATTVSAGTLSAADGTSLSATSPLALGTTTSSGVFMTSGSFVRPLAATAVNGAGTVTWTGTTGGGGFASGSGNKLVVAIGGLASPTPLTWGSGGFVPTGAPLVLNADVGLGEVEFRNPIDLGAVARTITVNDNVSTLADVATISGTLSGAGGILKNGNGYLYLVGANTYTGNTALTTTSTFVTSFGGTGVASSSLGGPGGSLLLGSGTNTVFVIYGGTGETSDRLVALAGTTGSTVIEASGTGPLILTNVSRTATGAGLGAFTFFLRGFNTDSNTVASVISNDTANAVTTVTKDGGGTWILAGANIYTGNTNVNTGMLGITNDNAVGLGTVTFAGGTLFSTNADRTLANNMTFNGDGALAGNFSFTINGTLLNTGGNRNFDNYLSAGKTASFNGLINLQDAANARTMNVRGTGTTIFNGTVQNGNTGVGSLNVAGADGFTLILANPTANGNTYTGTTTITRGILMIAGGGEQIPNGPSFGNVVMAPAAATVATLDLNGRTETVNAFTATSAGTTLITNTSASPASLIFGDNNSAVTIGAATGTFTITNGVGPLSLTKIGTGAATITSQVTATYTGATTVNDGTLTIAANLNGTNALNAAGGTLNVNGGSTGFITTIAASGTGVINFNSATTLAATSLLTATGTGRINVGVNFTNPGSIASVNVDGGSALSMIPAVQLTPIALSLGAGSGNATLSFGLGSNNADSSHIFASGPATTANNVVFNIFGLVGFGTSPTYDLLTASGGLNNASYSFGVTPIGYTLTFAPITPTLVRINVAPGAANTLYWSDLGTGTTSWAGLSGVNTNWFTDLAGTVNAMGVPGALSTVVFSSTAATVGAPIVTTLDGSYSIDSLQFTTNPAGVNGYTINPGAPASNKLVIAPASSANGISVADNVGTVTIAAGIQANAAQTWTVTGISNLLVHTGALTGAGSITKNGDGVAQVRDFSGYTGNLTLAGGTFGLQQNVAGNGVQVPFAGNITVTGANVGLDVAAPFVSVNASLGNQVTFGTFAIGTSTILISGSSTVTGNANASTTSYSLRAAGATTISGSPTFTMGTTQTAAAGLILAGPVTAAAATTISINGPAAGAVPQAPLAFVNTGNSFAAGSSFVVASNGILEGRVDEGGASSLGNLPISITSGTLRVGTVLSTPVAGTPGFTGRYINAVASTNYTFSYLQPAVGSNTTGVINAPNNASVFTPGPGMAANPAGFANTNNGIHFSGVLNITTPGYYGFNTSSDDGSITYVDGSVIAFNDGGHGFNGQMPWGTIFLSAGPHIITETFGQGTGGVGVVLNYSGPDTGNATALVGSIPDSVISPSGTLPTAALQNPITISTAARLEIATNTTVPSLTFTNALTLTVTSNGVLDATVRSTNPGPTVLQGNTTFTTLNANLTFDGPIAENVGPFNVFKNSWGTLTVNASNTYTGTTIIDAGGFISNAVQNMTGGLTIGNTNTTNSVANLTFNENATFSAVTWQNGRTAASNTLTIATGKTLTVTGNFFVGSNIDNVYTNILAGGGGSLTVSGAAANVRVGVSTGGTDNGNGSLLDLSALASSTFTLGTGTFTVGFQGDNTASTNEVRLAPVSIITAATLAVGASNIGGSATGTTVASITNSANLILGSTSNAITVDTLTIGNGNNRDQGQVKFSGASGSVTINNAADTGTVFNMGANATGGGGTNATGYIFINNFDVTGHNATLKFAASIIGNLTARVGANHNYFAFDTGSLTMLNLSASQKTGGTGTMNSTITLGGGTTTITNGILLFSRVSGATTGTTDAILNITGNAAVTIGATGGNSIRMAESVTAGRTATATLNFNGGTTSVSGHIIRVGGVGTTTATINLAGGTLIMNDQNIGTSTVPVNTINFTAGTLRNLGSAFQDITQSGGVHERTTAGTTTINGTYTLTGGTVRLADAGATFSTTSLTVNNSGVVRGIGTVSGPVTVNAGGQLTAGLGVGILTLNPGAGNTVTLNDNARLGLDIADATTPAAYGTGGSTYNPFLSQTINGGFNQTSGLLVASNGNATLLTVVVDGSAASFVANAQYSYKIAQVAGQDLTTLNIVSPALTLVPTGFNVASNDYSLTGTASGDIYLNFTPIPEPALLGVLLVGAGVLIRRRF